jgi:hypothetical protein
MPGRVHSRWRWRERYRHLVRFSLGLGAILAVVASWAYTVSVQSLDFDRIVVAVVLGLAVGVAPWLTVELMARLHLGRGWRLGE